MKDCVFCKIAAGEIPSKKVLETPDLVAFHDIRPQAPVHVQIIPRRHIESLNETAPGDNDLLGKIMAAAREIANKLDIAGDGYRVVNNCGRNAGMEVFHLHFHVLGGRKMSWPPG